MENINKLKRSEIDKDLILKNKILEFISINKIELDWVSNYKQIIYHYINDSWYYNSLLHCTKPSKYIISLSHSKNEINISFSSI